MHVISLFKHLNCNCVRIIILSLFLCVATLSPAQKHFPNIGFGINRHATDGRLVGHLNLGLLSKVDTLHGVQVGVFSSVVSGEMRGLSVGGLMTVSHRMKGFQIAGLTNVSTTPMQGTQIAGVTNISMGIKEGMQIAGAVNVCSGYMRGLQVAPYNYADSLNGSQIGVLNVAVSHPRGWQVGIINYTRDTIAHKIGLVNVNPKTCIDFLVFAGTISKFNGAMRFRNHSTYNMIGVGTHYLGLDKEFSGAIYYRLGQYFRLWPRWTVSGDVGFFHVETFKPHSQETPKRLYSLQVHVNMDYQVNEILGAFVSTGYGDTRYYSGGDYRHRFLFQGGISIRYNRK